MEIRPTPGAGKPALIQADPEPIEIDLQRTAVIVIDMQNAFVSKGGYLDLNGIDTSQGQKIIESIKDICNKARAKQVKVVFVAGVYSPDLREMGNSTQPYCVDRQR